MAVDHAQMTMIVMVTAFVWTAVACVTVDMCALIAPR